VYHASFAETVPFAAAVEEPFAASLPEPGVIGFPPATLVKAGPIMLDNVL
jgi:hypothetical protein